MKKLISWTCFFAIFMTHIAYAGEMITANDFGDIEKVCEGLARNSLVLFDVDATLIVPDDAILKPKGKKLFENLVAPYIDRDLFREIRMKAAHSLVDSRSIDLIRRLQQQEVPVIALTAAPSVVKGSESPGNWRVDELRQYGLEFQNAFPQDNFLVLPKSEQYQHFPMFKWGVLYSSFHPKGNILVAFLLYLHMKPDQVIFIDDELKHVQSVVSCLDKIGIDCIGIHYVAANEMACSLNSELARLQVDHFVKNEVWLSDKEGQEMLANH